MKTLVAIAAVALAGGSYVLSQEGQQQQPGGQERPGYGQEKQDKHHQQSQGIQVWKASQAEWKQADDMPQGVMKAKVHEGKNGASVYLMKFPAGTKIPGKAAQANKVIHVHQGTLTIGQGQASGLEQDRRFGEDKNRPGQGQQDQNRQPQGQQDRGFGQSQGAQGQSASDGDIVKIPANTTYWIQASSETLAVVATDGHMKAGESGQTEPQEEEHKVR